MTSLSIVVCYTSAAVSSVAVAAAAATTTKIISFQSMKENMEKRQLTSD